MKKTVFVVVGIFTNINGARIALANFRACFVICACSS